LRGQWHLLACLLRVAVIFIPIIAGLLAIVASGDRAAIGPFDPVRTGSISRAGAGSQPAECTLRAC
jgi:hypothetical protein